MCEKASMRTEKAALAAASSRLRPARDRRGRKLPTLWLFTDDARTPDPQALAGLAPAAGVVLRGAARAWAPRGRVLAVSADARRARALGAGLHLPGALLARPPFGWRHCRFLTAAVHDGRAAVRARRLGVAIGFISPVFPTASHPGAPCLGTLRARRLARLLGGRAGFLGGITAGRARGLGGVAWGAVAALLDQPNV